MLIASNSIFTFNFAILTNFAPYVLNFSTQKPSKTSWVMLPNEIWLSILDFVCEEIDRCRHRHERHRYSTLASIKGSQCIIEKHNFNRLRLKQDDIEEFSLFVTKRQHLVENIQFLVEIDSERQLCEASSVFESGIGALFEILRTWHSPKDRQGVGIDLEINILSSVDDIKSDDSSDLNYFDIDWTGNYNFSTVQIITGLLVWCQGEWNIGSRPYMEIFTKLPNLAKIRLIQNNDGGAELG